MNVLLVNPSSGENRRAGPYSRTLKPIAPLGLAYLAAVARKAGHRVAVEDQYASGIDAAGVAALARELGADVVGFACLAPSTACVSEAVAALRADGSRAHVTLGHLHASYFADDLLRDLPIDSVVFGEGEIGFGELLARLDSGAPLDGIDGVAARSDEGVARGGAARLVPDLDDLPAP
ncbi:cobalamin-dependent protein, partial [bacterium]|nr:cobalamin-dependent protein [bacterium]